MLLLLRPASLACFASSTLSIPDLTPQPEAANAPDSAIQTAIERMASLFFVLETVLVVVILLIPLASLRWQAHSIGA